VANAVAELLRKKLTVPNIYMKPRIPGLNGVDVVAVNHAGSGDVHGVEIAYFAKVPSFADLTMLIAKLKALPLHFKYLAVADPIAKSGVLADTFAGSKGFSPDGIGRLGLIRYSSQLQDDPFPPADATAAEIVVPPERFLLRGEKLARLENFISRAQPDMKVRI